MDERVRRQWAAAEARLLSWGGVSLVALATGLSRSTIQAGLKELKAREETGFTPTYIRRPGGGGKPLVQTDPGIVQALEELVAPETRGDPMSPLRWTLKSTRRLAAELTHREHPVSARKVAALLQAAGYSLQGNRKTREGGKHVDRDAQFRHINARVTALQARGQPVVSVDAKKKELVGDFKNPGQEWQPKGRPEEVRVYDFIDQAPDQGRVTPYGVYDLRANEGWVSVGTDHDTARFAVQTLGKWGGGNGALAISQRAGTVNHRRWRRVQLQPVPALESGAAGTGRHHRAGLERGSLSARYQQVEQDRTSFVLPCNAELARPAAGQP